VQIHRVGHRHGDTARFAPDGKHRVTPRELLRDELGNLEIDSLTAKVYDRHPEVVGEHSRQAVFVEDSQVDQHAAKGPRAHRLELKRPEQLPFVDQPLGNQALTQARLGFPGANRR
jgi:hypothetical protein